MYKESDHDGKGLSLLTRVAWVAVAFMVVFVILPGLALRSRTVTPEPRKVTVTTPMRCYSDKLVEGQQANSPARAVYICDPPMGINLTNSNAP